MIVALVQARMGSARLPGKVLAPIAGRPLLWHVWWRLSHAKTLDKVVIVTGEAAGDAPIAEFCAANGIPCFLGSEHDVLDRYYRAGLAYEAEAIVRVTGDCPLVDPGVVDEVVAEFQRGGRDVLATSPSHSFPDGFDVEVFTAGALATAWAEARDETDREHVTTFFYRQPGRFKIRYVENPRYHPFADLHLSVDDAHDLELVRRIFEHSGRDQPLFHLGDVVQALAEHPEWLAGHPATPINEGYFKTFFAEPGRPKPQTPPRSLVRSLELLGRAKRTVPSATQTFSKGYTQFVQGVSPVFVERGRGALVYDVDGNEYIDYPLGLGAVTVGHCHQEVDEAVIDQVRKGPSHSLPHRLEVELAERLCELVPCAEMVRFGKNGSDVTSGAVRVARAVTGREKIACCGYHGWQDWYIGTTTRRRGVPRAVQELTLPFPYGDVAALERLFAQHPDQIAAVIMEPVGTALPDPRYLSQVKDVAHRHGALLVFDEIITGFRLAMGGAQQYFGVVPDLACIGKGMGNGYPISAVVGRRDVMQEFDRGFFSFTFGGEAVSLAAALATLRVLERDGAISHSWVLGRKLKDGYNYLARLYGIDRFTSCQGLPPRTVMGFKDGNGADSMLFKGIFQQECVKRGILADGQHKFCLMHTQEQIDYTLAVYDEVFRVLEKAYQDDNPERFLEGRMPEPVFRRQDY